MLVIDGKYNNGRWHEYRKFVTDRKTEDKFRKIE
jgi:hypothetical protein